MSSVKPLPVDLRDHLGELSGNEFKVWLAYYLRTGDYVLTSHPSNETIGGDTGICEDTVKTCKSSLLKKGWLAYTGDYKQPRAGNPAHSDGGKFAVPVLEARLPWRPDWPSVVTEHALLEKLAQPGKAAMVENFPLGTMVENFHPEGSSSVSGSGSPYPSVSGSGACSSSGSDSGNPFQASKACDASPKNGRRAKPEPEPTATPTPAVPMAKPPKACKECGLELKRDENHLLTCSVLNKGPAWYKYEDDFGDEETAVARRLDNWEEL